jgi:hypothetical protein
LKFLSHLYSIYRYVSKSIWLKKANRWRS